MRFLWGFLFSLSAFAQTIPWTIPVRGSWVETGAAASGDITLASRDSVAEIVVSDSENLAVHQAADFLAGDIEKISGHKPAVVNTAAEAKVNIRLVTLGHGEVPGSIGAARLEGQWESYRIETLGRDAWLVGSNPRGTAFAAYTLSERLGIDPLYLWSGFSPVHHDPLVLEHTDFFEPPPIFRYRGFFHDDEDLLPRPFDANGYPRQTGDVPLDWYKRFFETALRLRMNMVAPYTRVHRRYEVQKLASHWGLYYTSHHYDILLSNPFGFITFNLAAERHVKPDYNWFTNREGMLEFWRGGLMENKDLDAIWPVGMRGTSDRAFQFPPGTTDEEKAATFREVIADEVRMVHSVIKTPVLSFTMYSEMLPQYQRDPAAFDLPQDVIIVWPDNNDGHMRALPVSLGKWKHGVYYHLAYLGGNLSKQLTHTVTPEVIADQFQKIVQAGATEYMLVNVSELRDYVMGARMIADIGWDAPAIYGSPGAADRYIGWWTREYFQPAASLAETAYHRYFSLLDQPDTLWTAMDTIQDLIARLSRKVAGERSGGLDRDALRGLESRAKLLDQALGREERAERQLPLAAQQFLSIDVGLGLRIAQRQAHAALKLDEALRAPDPDRMWQQVFEARDFLEELETDLARGEYPPFDRWYQESWIRSANSLNNPHRAYKQLRAFISSEGANAPRLSAPGASR